MCQCNPNIRTPFCGKGVCQWPENKISNIEEAKPHLSVNCGEKIHVIPVALIEDVIKGRKDLTQLDDWEGIIRRVFEEWLSAVRN